ncbi:hypothetical protein [Dactylosporangium salmoneum]|uniref:hypothetical protein n=1 Tax=Dactylosporangium salmoneum TaxID=53361 RepID=UPI0031D2613E
MRCYLIAEPPADLSPVRAALSDLGVEVVEPAHAFDSSIHSGRGWLPDVDFLCVLFAAERGWETPASVFLEIGQAVVSAIPVLVIAEPPRRLDAALSLLPVIRVPARSSAVLAAHIQLFMKSIGRPPVAAAPPRSPDAAELRSVRDELASLRPTTAVGGSGEAMHVTARRVEQLAIRLLRAAGAEAQATTGADGIGDIAVWVPGTENFIPGPLLVELRVVRDPIIDRSKLDQLQLYALSRDAQMVAVALLQMGSQPENSVAKGRNLALGHDFRHRRTRRRAFP